MIDFSNLKKFIIDIVESNSTIIYFGIGTQFYNTKKSSVWDFKENQQFPPFIHDAKLKYFDKKILIILIDPAFENNYIPYIVSSSNNFLENSWTQSKIHENLFESSMDITVITINEYINWGIYKSQSQSQSQNDSSNYIDMEPVLLELCEYISRPNINSILFYHEFTGKNVILLENSIKTTFNFDETKICIDITRGADLSCYFNLTNPENYPVITIYEDKLKYLNPLGLNLSESTDILNKYEKFSFDSNFNSKLVDKFETNYLIDKPDELILYFQIVKSDAIIFELLTNGIISMIRQFYTMVEKKNFGMGMWGVKYFNIIKSKINSVNFDLVEEKLKLIDIINCDVNSIFDYDLRFNEIKHVILEELYKNLKLSLEILLLKYNSDKYIIDNIINELKNIENKYDFIKYFKNFINLTTKINI